MCFSLGLWALPESMRRVMRKEGTGKDGHLHSAVACRVSEEYHTH